MQEDVIYLKNIHLPRIQTIDPNIDLGYLQEGENWRRKRQFGIETLNKNFSHDDIESLAKESTTHDHYHTNIHGISRSLMKFAFGINKGSSDSGLLSVPSYSTLLTLKKSISQRGNVCPLTQKHLVQLDWVSKEDGSHILTIGVHNHMHTLQIASDSIIFLFSDDVSVGWTPRLVVHSRV